MRPLPLLVSLAACASTHPVVSGIVSDDPAAARELARNAEAEVRREDPDRGPPAAAELAKAHGGWVEAMTAERVRVRVPDGELDAVMAALPALGEVADRHVRAQDMTEAHRDLEVRIDNLRRTRDRYLALLERAANVGEATAVEHELERITAQLELLEAQLERLQSRVQMAELSVEFSRKLRPGPVGWVFYGLFSAVKWLVVWG